MRALVVLLLIVSILGCGKGGDSLALKGEPKTVVGHFKWSIADGAGTPGYSGERDILLGEVSASAVPDDREIWKYQVPLGDDFYFGVGSSGQDTAGIGLYGGTSVEELFCWEWFNVGGSTATKLQESGELGVAFQGGRVSRIDFKTDVSLRLLPLNEAAGQEPKWRMLIAKGSYISFPRG